MTGDPSRRKMMPAVIPGVGATVASAASAGGGTATRRPIGGATPNRGATPPIGRAAPTGRVAPVGRAPRGEQESFRKFSASQLYCPKCKEAMPVRERLLLVLPSGNLYDYTCVKCGESLGSKTTRE